MYTLETVLQHSTKFMDPTGGELVQKVISKIPAMMNAVANDDVATVHQLLNDHKEWMAAITAHITHPQLREIGIERFSVFCKLVTCMNEGKCGYQDYFHYLSSCLLPFQTLYRSMPDC